MIIELIELWNLWQVTVISREAVSANRKPELVFLLENVEQILTGIDRKMPDSPLPRKLRFGTLKNQPPIEEERRYYVLFCMK